MTYSFRIRFDRSPTDSITTEDSEIVFNIQDSNEVLKLIASEPNESILNSNKLVLSAHGYASEIEALQAGVKYQSALTATLAKHRIGADFGMRSPTNVITNYGLEMFGREHGQRCLNDTHGLMVYETEPKPLFVKLTANYVRSINRDLFEKSFYNAISKSTELKEAESVSYILFNASFFHKSAESRFLLLMMAIEALVEQQFKALNVQNHVNELISLTQASKLTEHDKSSLLGTLNSLKKESISQAGKRLCEERLPNAVYHEMNSTKFFTKCYSLRSNLVHGNVPYPTYQQVTEYVGTLELFVSDLLSATS